MVIWRECDCGEWRGEYSTERYHLLSQDVSLLLRQQWCSSFCSHRKKCSSHIPIITSLKCHFTNTRWSFLLLIAISVFLSMSNLRFFHGDEDPKALYDQFRLFSIPLYPKHIPVKLLYNFLQLLWCHLIKISTLVHNKLHLFLFSSHSLSVSLPWEIRSDCAFLSSTDRDLSLCQHPAAPYKLSHSRWRGLLTCPSITTKTLSGTNGCLYVYQ